MLAYHLINHKFIIKCLLIFFIAITSSTAQISFASLPCNHRNPKVIGGQEVEEHEHPFIVSLTKRGGHICGATIIHELWLLTAGHCVCNGLNKFLKPNQIQGIIGLHRISQNHNSFLNERASSIPKQVNFKDIIPHPQYKCEDVKNDIALLELIAPIKFTSHIQPTCLMLDSSNTIYEDTFATVSGWGWTNENRETGDRSDVLRKATVRVWNNKECEKSYQSNGKQNSIIAETQMCAGYTNGGIDSCWADSGGPLISKEQIQIGVVSTGVGCARPGLPGIYTRVSKYIHWIQSVLSKR